MLLEQLKRDEGIRLKPYRDSVGKLTIGIGRNLDDVGISEDEADMLLQHDIDRAKTTLAAHIPWSAQLDEARLGALVNLTFNMGIGGLLEFKHFLQYLEEHQYEAAASELLKSKWASEVGLRASRLAQQIRTGQWQ